MDYRLFGGYRLFLAWLVMTSHSSQHLPPWVLPLALGNVGVFTFFVLSGFVIAEACDRFYSGAPQRFLANRLLRIYPTYWLACVVALAVYLSVGHPELRLDAASVVGNLAIVYAKPGTFFWLSLIWAVAIELRFYFLAAAMAAAQAWLKLPARLVFTAASVLALSLYVFTMSIDYTNLAAFRHAPYFMLGMATYYAISRASRAGLLAAAVAVPFTVHAYYTYSLPGAAPLTTTVLFVAAAIAMAALAYVRVTPSTARVDKALGDLTYPLYLSHWPMVYLVDVKLPGQGFVGYLVISAASFAVAGAMVLLEMPITRLRDRVRRRRLYP